MCGIVAFYNFGNSEKLRTATEVVAHRGPDNQSLFWSEQDRVGLGHRRLSIIDLSTAANQPLWTNDNRYCIVFNGEVFNYLSIRKELLSLGVSFKTNSDTEVLLLGFQYFGLDILHKISGMFSFVIYDSYKHVFFAARDQIGIKPFYYYFSNGQLIIASEIKSITNVTYIEPDYQAIQNPIHFQTGPLTGFQNINKLDPGHYLTFDGKQLEIKNYWEINIKERNNSPFLEKQELLDQLLNQAVKNQMLSDVPIGVLLSGGLDSSLIAALMRKNYHGSINSFTIRIGEKDLKKQGIVNDATYASMVAKKFDFNHQEIKIDANMIELLPKMVYHLEEILVDPAAINTYLISRSAKSMGISVLLSGIGADEIFGGYRIHRAMEFLNKKGYLNNNLTKLISLGVLKMPNGLLGSKNKYIRWIKKIALLLNLPKNQRHLFAKDAAILPYEFNKAFNTSDSIYETNHVKKELFLFNKFPYASYLNKLCLSDASNYLPNHNLTYMDKMMMAAGIEGRPPLIDKEVVDFAFTCLPKDKIINGNQKYILKEVSKKYLPHEIIDRPKAPFAAPLRSWLISDLKEMVHDLVNDKAIRNRGIYNVNYVKRIMDQHYSGKEDHSQMIFKLLVTEIWFSTFFDKK
jgi:asparagine synthase (glutamine-hydrolysing)